MNKNEIAQSVALQFQELLQQAEMRLSDAIASGSDFVQTTKIMEASKFYTEPIFWNAKFSNNRTRFVRQTNKPLDLSSLQISFGFSVTIGGSAAIKITDRIKAN